MAAGGTKNPFIEELKAMKQRMEELFPRSLQFGSEDAGQTRSESWLPFADIIDAGDRIIYTLDLPGVQDQDLQVECKAGSLWVSGSRSEEAPEGEALRTERPTGAFSRIFKLPCPIRQEDIEADLKKGVLRIVVPKKCDTTDRPQRVVIRRED